MIYAEGVERFCADLEVDPTDVVLLVVSYHLKSKRMCEITKEGWLQGWRELRCDSLDLMKQIIPQLRDELKKDDFFKEIYRFSFSLSLDENQRSLPCDVAIPMWKLLLDGKYAKLDTWCEFVEKKHGKSISKDTWNLFYDFVIGVGIDLNKFDADGAWPVLIDDYVKYLETNKP